MATSFRETFITFALIGIFIFASISFIVTTQLDNDVENTILEDDVINRTYAKLETNLSAFQSTTQTQKGSFELEIPERGFGSLIIFSIISVGQKFTALISAVYRIMIILPMSILNVPKLVIDILTSILVVSLVLLIWRVYRVGG